MKTLQQYILEYNTPDWVNLHRGKITLNYDTDGAFPFIINIETKVIVFGDEKSIHGDMFEFMSSDDFKSLGLPKDVDMWDIRYCDDYAYQAKKGKRSHGSYNKWKATMMKMYPYLYTEDGNPKYMTGRIWDVPRIIGANEIKQYPEYKAIAVAWWCEIDGTDYVDLTKYVIQEAEAEELIGNIAPVKDCTLFGVDNNGGVINLNKVKKVAKQTAASKEQQQLAQAIHLANQKEKDEFYKEFRKHRDEKNQTELYNHTKSKTEAEYRSIKYQESLEHETINEYIQKKHITHVPGAEITDFNQMIEGNYYTLKQFGGDYSIFKFQSLGKDEKGYYELCYFELLSVSDDWTNGQIYLKSHGDGCNFLTMRDNHAKIYNATDEEIKEIEQARK